MTWNLIGSIWEFKIFRYREVKSFSIHHNLTWFQSILVIFGHFWFQKILKTRIWRNEIIHQKNTDTIGWDNSSITCHIPSRDSTLDTSLFQLSIYLGISNFWCSGSSGCEIRIWKSEKFENVRKWMVYGTKIFIKIV